MHKHPHFEIFLHVFSLTARNDVILSPTDKAQMSQSFFQQTMEQNLTCVQKTPEMWAVILKSETVF